MYYEMYVNQLFFYMKPLGGDYFHSKNYKINDKKALAL